MRIMNVLGFALCFVILIGCSNQAAAPPTPSKGADPKVNPAEIIKLKPPPK